MNSTETPRITLTDFLLARIAEDEADAHQLSRDLTRWEREKELSGADGTQGSIVAATLLGSAADPARVLAECEAKRRILDMHDGGRRDTRDLKLPGGRVVAWVSASGCRCGDLPPCRTLRALALPYADHPAHRDEWRA